MSDRIGRALLRVANHHPPDWRDPDLDEDFGEQREQLMATGWIRPLPPSLRSTCPHCEPGTMSIVMPLKHPETGAVRHWVHCRSCGMSEVSANSLRRWQLDLDALADCLARALSLKGQRQVRIPDSVWFLGRGAWAKRSHEVFWLRALHRENLPRIRDYLCHHPKAVLLATHEQTASLWHGQGSQQVVLLTDVLSFDGQWHVNTAWIEETLCETPTASKPKKPPGDPRLMDRLAQIRLLKLELRRHLAAAKDYARSKEEMTGEPELLPRPTKKALGERVGIPSYQVTRCFKNGDAELKMLWDAACNLDHILGRHH